MAVEKYIYFQQSGIQHHQNPLEEKFLTHVKGLVNDP